MITLNTKINACMGISNTALIILKGFQKWAGGSKCGWEVRGADFWKQLAQGSLAYLCTHSPFDTYQVKRLWGSTKLSIKGEGLGALQFGEEAAITFPSPPEMPTRPTDCVTDLHSDSYSEHTKPSHVIKSFYMIRLFPKTSFFFRAYLIQLIL